VGAEASIPASAGDIMIEVPKPVAVLAAVNAHFSLSAVTMILPAHIGNISANVSSISTPLHSMYPVDGGLLSVKAGYLDGSGSMANRFLRSACLVRIQVTFNKALRFPKICASLGVQMDAFIQLHGWNRRKP
jgi:hypothetical protein